MSQSNLDLAPKTIRRTSSTVNVHDKPFNVPGKGAYCTQISSHLSRVLSQNRVQTHFYKQLNMLEQCIYNTTPTGIDIRAHEHMQEERLQYYGLSSVDTQEGLFIEVLTKKGIPISPELAIGLGITNPYEQEALWDLSVATIRYISGIFTCIGFPIASLYMSFGYIDPDSIDSIVLNSHLTPDNLTFLNPEHEKSKKETELYATICKRLLY